METEKEYLIFDSIDDAISHAQESVDVHDSFTFPALGIQWFVSFEVEDETLYRAKTSSQTDGQVVHWWSHLGNCLSGLLEAVKSELDYLAQDEN